MRRRVYRVSVSAIIENTAEGHEALEYVRVLKNSIAEGVSLDWAGGLLGEISARDIKVRLVQMKANRKGERSA